jgi:hypothetical protein
MISLRRYYHRHFGHHERFHLAVVLTIIVVAYVAVPRVVHYVEALRGYAPAHYEPKDVERQEWLSHHTVEGWTGVSFDVLVDVVLFVLVAIVWLTLVPVRAGRHRSPPR